jgi:GT2 family glycosyltransferase
MDLGIVVVNWNVREVLAACLDSVYADLAQGGLGATVCVVDNGSTDGSAAMLRAQFPRTQVIETDNRGMGAGNNVGLRALGFSSNFQLPTSNFQLPTSHFPPPTSHLPFAALILNPDTIVHPGALRHLVEFLRAHPGAGVVAPKLLNPDGTLQHSGFRFPGFRQAALDLFPPPGRFSRLLNASFNGRYPVRWYASGTPFQVDHTLGAAFAVRGQTIAECGMFDETFYMYCEEIDWQWRMARAGWERWVAPAAVVTHYGGQSTAQIPAASLLHLWSSRRRLYQRYQAPALNALVARLVLLGMRRHIRLNHERSQRGELPADQRAEMNRAMQEIIRVWQARRLPLLRSED